MLPCKQRGKEPLVKGGWQAATTDPDRVVAWWREWPYANIGYRPDGRVVLDVDVPVGTGEFGPVGSTWDRYMVRVREILESLKIVRQVMDQMPSGDPNAALPRRVRPPAGDVYMRTESPRGEIGFYIVSDGSEKPFRCKGRSPCFTAISALSAISKGALVADAVAIVGSLDIVLGEVDR